MKKQSNTSFSTLGNLELENLTTVVNETIATAFGQSRTKSFTPADLWNIQRQGKSRTQRRFL